MSRLVTNEYPVESVFQLIGYLENDISKSIAWALTKCPEFLKSVLKSMLEIDVDPDKIEIIYQNSEKGKGITDLEITDYDTFFVIVEAKRGWILPGAQQLTMYSERKDLTDSKAATKAIITMSECSEIYANLYLPFKEVNDIPIKHLSWKKVYDAALEAKRGSNHAQKNLLDELIRYLGGIMGTQRKDSNWVYVVALSNDKAGGGDCELSYIDIVTKKKKYYHPVGNRWPSDPVNYIAFRYGGQLQSIHHVDNYTVSKNLHEQINEMPDVEEETPHFVYDLGPAIIPSKTVKCGNSVRQATRVWAMIDTLLTAETITEAMEKTKERL